MRYLPVALLVFAFHSSVALALAEAPLVRTQSAREAHQKFEPERYSARASKDAAATKLGALLVKLTPVQTAPEHARLAAALDSASHTAIAGIPGITVLGDSEDEIAMAKKSRKPVVVLSGKLQKMGTSK